MNKPLVVTLIDGDPLTGRLVVDFLQSANIDAYHAPSIAASSKLIRKLRPDLILLDWYLEDGTGADFIDLIRGWNTRWQDIAIIWLPARALIGDEESCLSLGGVDYISKPFHLDLLLEKIALHTKTDLI